MTTENTLIRLPELQQRLGGIGKTTVYELIKRGEFPAPHKLGPRIAVWPSAVVDAWLAAKYPASTAAPDAQAEGGEVTA